MGTSGRLLSPYERAKSLTNLRTSQNGKESEYRGKETCCRPIRALPDQQFGIIVPVTLPAGICGHYLLHHEVSFQLSDLRPLRLDFILQGHRSCVRQPTRRRQTRVPLEQRPHASQG
jgi:hypothetical protein